HPVSFLRNDLDARGVVRHDALPDEKNGKRVTVAGLVLVRQRPGIGNAIFMTLEDETGIANTILWPRTYERFRPVILGSRLIAVSGVVQNEKGVIHIVGDHFDDLTPLLRRLSLAGPTIDPSAPTDEAKRPVQGSWRRHPRQGDDLVMLLRDKQALSEAVFAGEAAQVMPKGRNFH